MSNAPTPSDFTAPEPQEIAELLPAYEILSFIAKGGMGAVYKARQKSLDRDVAIKILPRHFSEDAEFRASFESEAKSMAKLNHPNLIGIYDFGQIDGMLYIIMEMVQGESLYHSSYGKTTAPAEATRIVSSICDGLTHAHKHGILHRDIKPANILLDTDNSPKIGDFGLAHSIDDRPTDSAFGTPGYSAPEIIHNLSSVDESTDIYSVGAILYELLTNKLPETPYTPAATLVDCDPRFDAVIRKAMNITPALRYRSAQEMIKALDAITNTPPKPSTGLIHTASHPTSSTARTLLTATPAAKKPGLNTGKHYPHTKRVTSKSPVTSGSNSPVTRNVIIIIALLAGIFIAWEGLKVVRAKRAKKNEAIQKTNDELKKTTAAEATRKKAEALANRKPLKKSPQSNKTDLPKSHTGPETPRETLSRLRSPLSRGKRSEMPKGTITREGRARFYIAEKMTWHEALHFCENHGGHLAILPNDTHLQWITSRLKSDQTIWLGAGSAGYGDWRWIDGTPWQLEIRKTSKASYVTVDDTTVLSPQLASTKHSFFIEWMADGSTPANLENQLKRCAKSLSTTTPLFPAGTISYDNRHYLIIHQDTRWETARDLAKLAGGTLSVPSNSDENEWMLTFLASNISPNQACWIGGIRQPNKTWAWSTGEPWKFAKWGENLPDEDTQTPCGCAVTSAQTWDDYTLDSELPYLLIEWSKDGQTNQTAKTTGKNQAGVITPIRKKCATLIQTIQKQYKKQFTTNIKGYEQELRVFNRGLPKSSQEAYSAIILEMKKSYPNNQIPKNIPRGSMPQKLGKILDSRLSRQSTIEDSFISEIETLRGKYRKNLLKMSKTLKSKGLTSKLRTVQQEIKDTTKGGHDFIRHVVNSP